MSKLDPTRCYLKLFHGRKDLEAEMEDWGESGPILGPLNYVHTTYGTTIHCSPADQSPDIDLKVIDDCVYYDGMYYGDWSVTTALNLTGQEDKVVQIDEAKAKI